MNTPTQKSLVITSFVVLCTAGIVILFISRKENKSGLISSSQMGKQVEKDVSELLDKSPLSRAETRADINLDRSPKDQPQLTITLLSKPPALAEPAFTGKLQGYGENAVISNAEGKVLLKGTDIAPIYSIRPSPSGDQIIVSRGNGVHQIYRIDPFLFVQELPSKPEVPRATAFGPWHWLDEDTLIGVSAIERSPNELKKLTAAEQESQWREKTLLYSFGLENNAINVIDATSVALPASFSVIKIQVGGLINVEWDEKEKSHTAWIEVSSVKRSR